MKMTLLVKIWYNRTRFERTCENCSHFVFAQLFLTIICQSMSVFLFENFCPPSQTLSLGNRKKSLGSDLMIRWMVNQFELQFVNFCHRRPPIFSFFHFYKKTGTNETIIKPSYNFHSYLSKYQNDFDE